MMLNVSHDAVKEKHVVDKKELWIRYAVRSTESFVFFVYRVLSAPENEITNIPYVLIKFLASSRHFANQEIYYL